MKIGILGGTFDPVHRGHLALARAAWKEFHLDRVIFVPALIPPHKAARRDLTPAPYRYRMVEMALAGEPAFEISDVELNRPAVSYTVDTLREFQKKYPDAELFLILGEDALADFSKWHERDSILRLARFLAAPRRSKCHAPNIPEGMKIDRIPMPVCPISSSEIREKIRGGEIPQGVFPEEVGTYIRQMHLYTSKPSCPSS